MKYRREIDGLRALAVIPVIFFHAGFHAFGGGFVGVDVFFVISGYLITSIILLEKQAGTFTLVGFYERRARRILPALFVVMVACLPFAWLWMLPSDLKNLSQGLMAVSGFASNILFWLKSGYFESSAELNPLLHTWSLAVEEQYYVLFPIFLLLTWRLGRRWIVACLLVSAIIGLAVAQWGSVNKPAAAFFLLPTRGWEILLGALVAFYLIARPRIADSNRVASQLLSFSGLVLITCAVFAYDKHTPFPSLYTLLPTIGTALVILFATNRTFVGRALGNKVFVGIGLISYSSYLWHQPLFAFARYRSIDEPSRLVLAALAVLAVILAYFSWKFVETPLRNRQRFSRKQVFAFGVIGSTFFVAAGLFGHLSGGAPDRFSAEERSLLALGDRDFRQTMDVYGLGKCFIDYDQNYEVLLEEDCVSNDLHSNRVVVFGDSQAAHWMSGVREVFPQMGFSVEQWTGASCRAVQYSGNNKRCRDFYNAFVASIVPGLGSSDLVVVSSNWMGVFDDVGKEAFGQSVNSLFEVLRGSGVHVLVIGSTPTFSRPPHHIMVKQRIKNEGTVFLRSADFRDTNYWLKRESEKFDYTFLHPGDVLCASENTLSCMVSNEGSFYFFDRGHLSVDGSKFVMRRMVEELGLRRHAVLFD